ncbi:hypothetical protein EMMF5_005008 [Cystobasidiomycetes sp. EMM_F5]
MDVDEPSSPEAATPELPDDIDDVFSDDDDGERVRDGPLTVPATTTSATASGSGVEGSGDENEGNDDDDDDEDDEEDAAAQAVQSLTVSEREILTLLAVDKKLTSVLDLAANALDCLGPPQAASAIADPLKLFEAAASEYYKALDDIQLTLRNSIHLVRQHRIPPSLLVSSLAHPASTSVLSPSGPIAPGVVPAESADTSSIDAASPLGKGAMRMQAEAWNDLAQALHSLQLPRSGDKTSPDSLDDIAHSNGLL